MQIVVDIASIVLKGCLEAVNECNREGYKEEGRNVKSGWRKEGGGGREENSLGVVKCTILIKGRAHFNSIMSLRLGAKGCYAWRLTADFITCAVMLNINAVFWTKAAESLFYYVVKIKIYLLIRNTLWLPFWLLVIIKPLGYFVFIVTPGGMLLRAVKDSIQLLH